jgi:hypothetical protein
MFDALDRTYRSAIEPRFQVAARPAFGILAGLEERSRPGRPSPPFIYAREFHDSGL